jgi:hypothetical protein
MHVNMVDLINRSTVVLGELREKITVRCKHRQLDLVTAEFGPKLSQLIRRISHVSAKGIS